MFQKEKEKKKCMLMLWKTEPGRRGREPRIGEKGKEQVRGAESRESETEKKKVRREGGTWGRVGAGRKGKGG